MEEEEGKDTCNGDSGGPLLCNDGKGILLTKQFFARWKKLGVKMRVMVILEGLYCAMIVQSLLWNGLWFTKQICDVHEGRKFFGFYRGNNDK
ncbi:Trypsin domain containing protein [Asbolus verrucosus]|uniref:Trypsin domain containing protein n=1 Tax=Asbolus verrucosus TaxID=1661398 RepID=A0A482VGC7_ASBVE|nr:Trypsin domain containing protein [Asbolus verrucosus]